MTKPKRMSVVLPAEEALRFKEATARRSTHPSAVLRQMIQVYNRRILDTQDTSP